jgi:O-antigen/teichoic acid export membrane protein
VASVRFLLRDSAVYGLSNALVKLTALLTVPIMTRALGQAEFGATDALMVYLSVLVALATFGQDSAVARFFYDVDGDDARRQVVTQALLVQLALCAIVLLGALVLAPRILASEAGRGYAGAYPWVVACAPLVLLFQFWRGLLKWTLARNAFVILSVGSAVVNLSAIALLATSRRLDVRTFFIAQLMTNGVATAAGAWLCRAHLTRPRGLAFAAPMLRFGAPYAAVLLAGIALPALDRAIVTSRLGLAPLAEYAVASKYATLLLFPVMAFQTAWGPFCYATYRDPGAAGVYSRVLALLAAMLAVVAFTLSALAEPIIRLVASPAYVSAAPIVVPIVFGLAAEGCSWILGIGIDLSKRTMLSVGSYGLGLAVSAAAAWLLVGPYGLLGVAAGISAGRVAQAIAYSWLGQRAYPLAVRWRRPVAVLVTALALAVVAVGAQPGSTGALVALRLGALVVLLAVVATGIDAADRARLLARVGLAGPGTRQPAGG